MASTCLEHSLVTVFFILFQTIVWSHMDTVARPENYHCIVVSSFLDYALVHTIDSNLHN